MQQNSSREAQDGRGYTSPVRGSVTKQIKGLHGIRTNTNDNIQRQFIMNQSNSPTFINRDMQGMASNSQYNTQNKFGSPAQIISPRGAIGGISGMVSP